MISAVNIAKAYNGPRVLDDIALNLPRGRLTALIGPNGSGKSTLLHILARLMDWDEGDVSLDGTALKAWHRRDLSRKIAFLPQRRDIGIRVTVEELSELGRYPHSRGRLNDFDRSRTEWAMDTMDVSAYRGRSIATLSGGQRQRAFIAMALAQDADYLLLDEPLNNLDLHHAVGIMQTLGRLSREEEKGIVIVMHDINLASLFCDDIIVLNEGRVHSAGPADDVMSQELLSEVYSMPLAVREWQGRQVCLVDIEGLGG